jgi:hypothetical protein
VRENRTHGSEGGDGESRFRPLSDFGKVQLLRSKLGKFNPIRLNTISPWEWRARRKGLRNRVRSSRFRRHALLLQFLDGVGSFFEVAHTQTFEHVRCLGELDVVIGHDFDPVTPGIAEIESLIDAL